jgi:hypothetical protein
MKARRGLSSVVGMTFAIIALITTVAYITYSMNLMSNYNMAVLTNTQTSQSTANEKFQIASFSYAFSKPNITIANTGTIPVNITKIYIQNTTAYNQGTDWTQSFNMNYLAPPGGTARNIGQSISGTINSANSYNIKLVTSRGNTQQFTVNSANAAPLNIQLRFIPTIVASGFNSTLQLIVINNSTGTLTNISPSSLPAPTGSAICTSSSPTPSNYNTLSPGSAAIFTWQVKLSGSNGQSCTYNLTQPLQNGYSQTVAATAAISVYGFTQSNLAQSVGILTMNFTTFRWTQGTQWNTGFSLPANTATAFSVQVTNNNSTGDFYISKNSAMIFYQSINISSDTYLFYIVNATSFSPFGVTPFGCGNPNDYCIKIPAGQTKTLYFASSQSGGSNIYKLCKVNSYLNFMVIYGKFATSRIDTVSKYGQTIPYIAVQATGISGC